MDRFEVVTFSEEYGLEHFIYDTEKEAEKGYERLKASCAKLFKVDGIVREVILVKDRFVIE